MKIMALALLMVPGLVSATESWRVGNRIIVVGDAMPHVLQVAGQPTLKSRIESREGGTVGNRWYYVREGYNAKTVTVTFRGGRVTDIAMEKD